MSTIIGHYNVTVDSRYYAFLQDDMESVEPHVLIATVEKKRELLKENKTKAKKEKRNKQIAEASKENIKVETTVEENLKVENEIIENKQEPVEKPVEIVESVTEEKNFENKFDRSTRGRGNIRRQNGGPRRGGYPRNEERQASNDDGNQQKFQDNGYSRFSSSNRGRPPRKERPETENVVKFGYFEDQSGSTTRGNSVRRRSSGRPSSRYSRGNDRNVNDRNTGDRNISDRPTTDRNTNDRQSYDRNSYDRNSYERSSFERNTYERNSYERSSYDRSGNERNTTDRNTNDRIESEENFKTDIIPDNMGTFEEMSSRPPRSNRGRFPRSNRGSFNRFSTQQDNENDFENNRIGYFDENFENREFRGGRGGRPRGSRGRRGRGDYWRPRGGQDRDDNPDDGCSNNFTAAESRDMPVAEKWPDVDEELSQEPAPANTEPVNPDCNATVETDLVETKKSSNWGEIEDDPVDLVKPLNEHMTLEEWKALHAKDRLLNQEGKENRKANDGQDVFSGMEVYRKGKVVEEPGDEHETPEMIQHGRQKQSIPVSIRFSRNTDYGDSSGPNFDPTSTDSRSYSRTGPGASGYYRPDNRFRGSDNSTGGRGRGRGGGDRGGGGGASESYSRGGRYFNRGRGGPGNGGGGGGGDSGSRFNRNNSFPAKRHEDQVDGVNINLGNEDEFPTLS